MTSEPATCEVTEGCITCGDVAVPLVVVQTRGFDAQCRDEKGRTELVATELVGDVQPGDRVLVHAGVAIERLSAAPAGG
ncbi:MAG: HypC/HybG/HupF family hydrogenase formation chaperone [Actinomycetota bacterium]